MSATESQRAEADRALTALRSARHLARRVVARGGGEGNDAELASWREELLEIARRRVAPATDGSGVAPAGGAPACSYATACSINALHMLSVVRPARLREPRIGAEHIMGERVLGVRCAPLASRPPFDGHDRDELDPRAAAGGPIPLDDALLVIPGAEAMPYPDGYFDAVASVTSSQSIDGLFAVASEIERVLRPGGHLVFELEQRSRTAVASLSVDDHTVEAAFRNADLRVVARRSPVDRPPDVSQSGELVNVTLDEPRSDAAHCVTWHGVRR